MTESNRKEEKIEPIPANPFGDPFYLENAPDLPKVQCKTCGQQLMEELCIRYSGCFHSFCPSCFLAHMDKQNLNRKETVTCPLSTCDSGRMHSSTATERVRDLHATDPHLPRR